ncbi:MULTISPECIES: hypothetical protein [Xanthobacter]|uniref:hypothetical protein n=1 Tax=Xanthobacter TaxID=279 RepID=UPI001F1F008D|nr:MULTISPECIES: hypothetical protein [unclassified Xanthobacter]
MAPVNELDPLPSPSGSYWKAFLIGEIPHLVILALTIGGVAYISLMRRPLEYYWDVVAVVIASVSIYSGWPQAKSDKQRWRLVWTQALHWAAFLITMRLVFLPSVQAIADVDSTNLVVLLLLALGTFVAGVHAPSWRMALNGVVMGASVPAVAWLDRSALVLALVAMVLGAMVLALAWYHFRERDTY